MASNEVFPTYQTYTTILSRKTYSICSEPIQTPKIKQHNKNAYIIELLNIRVEPEEQFLRLSTFNFLTYCYYCCACMSIKDSISFTMYHILLSILQCPLIAFERAFSDSIKNGYMYIHIAHRRKARSKFPFMDLHFIL